MLASLLIFGRRNRKILELHFLQEKDSTYIKLVFYFTQTQHHSLILKHFYLIKGKVVIDSNVMARANEVSPS